MKLIDISAVLLVLASCFGGQAFAETPVREAAARLSAALAGDAGQRRALVRDHFTTRLREDTGEAAWLATLDAIARASGGIELVSAEQAETDRFAEFTVRARDSGRYARLVLGVARAEPERISTLYLFPARDPDAVSRTAWPRTRIDPARLSAEIGRRVDALVDEDLFSGAVLVARNGEVMHEQYAGLVDRTSGARNGPATTFNLASMGKMFTAIAIGQLADQGRLSLDDTVERWIPDYPEQAGRAITIAQLLAHTSGLGDVLTADYRASPASYLTAESYLPLIAQPLLFEPGTRLHYSNAGYSLLGIIIERASGESYIDYVEGHVFAPARMTNAGFPRLDRADPNRAVGYFRSAEDAFGLGERQSNESAIGLQGNAAGGAYATARDVHAFARALRAQSLVSPASSALLQAPRNDLLGAPTPTRYGYGFAVHECNGRTFIGHNGGGAQSGVHSTLLMSADGEWSIVVLSNYDAGPEDVAMSLCRFLALQ